MACNMKLRQFISCSVFYIMLLCSSTLLFSCEELGIPKILAVGGILMEKSMARKCICRIRSTKITSIKDLGIPTVISLSIVSGPTISISMYLIRGIFTLGVI